MKVLVAGDYCPQERVADLFEKNNFSSVFGSIKPLITEADVSIVNLECPVCDGDGQPIKKVGPNLHCSSKGIEAMKWAGFNCVTLANNHFFDYGKEGVENTLQACKEYDLDIVGGGMNFQEASKVLYKKINGETLAIINCCEHEFSIATEDSAGSNPLNPIQQYYAIKEAKKKADYVLVIIHGGHEMWQLPSPRMQETYRFLIDAGADAVVNHHQHCYSGYEFYNDKPIVYGLGNFCFDKQGYLPELWCYGYMVNINLSNKIKIDLYPYEQCRKEPKVMFLSNRKDFEERIKELNDIISTPSKLQEETYAYYSKNKKNICMAFEPYRGRILNKLYLLGLLPSFLSNNKKKKLLNLLQCESHRDKVLHNLNTD